MKKILLTLLAVSFLDVLSFSFILPTLPFIVRWFWWWAIAVSICVAASAMWMFIWWITLWRLSDRYWRKDMILISMISNIAWYIIFAYSKNLEIFILSRFICWFGWWWISVVQAFIWDISDESERLKNNWYSWASIWLWFTLWPILWWALSWIWLHSMWIISAIIMTISLITAIINLPEKKAKYEDKITITWHWHKMNVIFFSFFLITAAFAWMQTIFWLYLNDRFWLWADKVAYTFWYLWIVAIIYQILVINPLSWKIKESSFLILWLTSLSLWYLLVPFIEIKIIFYIILCLFPIWITSTNTSIYSLISKLSLKKDYWKNMWINTAYGSVADIVWPLLSWILYTNSYKYPFYVFWMILSVNLVYIWMQFESKKKL